MPVKPKPKIIDPTLKPGTPEYEIAVEQLNRLRDISRQRLFSPEEYKLYDILVKSLKLLNNEPDTTTLPGQFTNLNDIKTLIQIARDEKVLKDERPVSDKDDTDDKPSRSD